jgi:hypothetical protein
MGIFDFVKRADKIGKKEKVLCIQNRIRKV